MAELVSLRAARTRKARAEAEQKAAANRLRFGRTRAEKELAASGRRKDENHLDAHRLEDRTKRDEKP